MPVAFFNALMLAALGALTIPVLIHLLLKRKKKRVRFSTLQFFLKQDQQSTEKRKLRHWLLLALRLLIFTLLVLAFARPYLPASDRSNAAQPARQVVFVLDRSASMQATESDGQRWGTAKERIGKVLSSLVPQDRVALISCASQTEVISGFSSADFIATTMKHLQPGFGVSDLGEGLKQAARLIAQGDARLTSTIYLVGDLQRSSCSNLAAARVPLETGIKFMQTGDLRSPNLAVTQLRLGDADGTKPAAVIVNFSDEPSGEVTAELNLDGSALFSAAVRLEAGAATNLEFMLPALKPGWHDLKASIRTPDSLRVDDTRYGSIFVPKPLQVALVETRKARRIFDEETFFLMTALDPAKTTTNSVPTAYQVTKLGLEDFMQKLSSAQKERPWDVVMLPGLKQVPAGLAAALARFAQMEGGILMFLGEGLSANRYNIEFRELLPGRIGLAESAPDGGSWRISEFDTNNPAFAPFRVPNSGDFRIPEFTRRYAVTVVADAQPLMLFDDGTPLLAGRAIGGGRLALVNTSSDTSWTDWPKHKTFVPWLHGMGKYLAPGRASAETGSGASLSAGQEIEITLGVSSAKSSFKWAGPDGEESAATADERGSVRLGGLAPPGIYRLRNAAGEELRRIAVNLEPEESNLAALTPGEAQTAVAQVPADGQTPLAAGFFGSRGNQKEFWRVLLLVALALLFIEVALANRTFA